MASISPTLLVLAAGIGSRFGGLKQLEGLGPRGETLLELSVRDAARAGFGRVVVVIRRDIEAAFRERLDAPLRALLPVEYAYQERDALPAPFAPPPDRTKPWGTGHALLVAAPLLRQGPFAVINADDYYGAAAYPSLVGALRHSLAAEAGRAEFFLVAYPLGRTLSEHGTVSRGVCTVDADGLLAGLTERTALAAAPGGATYAGPDGAPVFLPASTPVSMNLFGLTPALLDFAAVGFARFLAERIHDLKAEYYLPYAVHAMVEAGLARVRVLPTDAPWLGVTYPQDKESVRAALARLEA